MNTTQPKSLWKTGHKVTLTIIGALLLMLGYIINKGSKPNVAYTPAQKDSIARVEQIKQSFSSVNGSQYKLVEYVKASMNDPKSFVHVKTVYYDFKKNLAVEMTYRGKNGFGGVVTETVLADTDIEGNILSVNKIK